MGERYPGEITIGGKVPAELLEEFLRRTRFHRRKGGRLRRRPVRCRRRRWAASGTGRDGHLVLADAEASYGQFEELEAFCVEHGIPFDRHSDAQLRVRCRERLLPSRHENPKRCRPTTPETTVQRRAPPSRRQGTGAGGHRQADQGEAVGGGDEDHTAPEQPPAARDRAVAAPGDRGVGWTTCLQDTSSGSATSGSPASSSGTVSDSIGLARNVAGATSPSDAVLFCSRDRRDGGTEPPLPRRRCGGHVRRDRRW